MALKKLITNRKGIATSYHKIKEVTVQKINPRADGEESVSLFIIVSSFVTQSYREASDQLSADSARYTLVCPLKDLVSTPILALCYDKLKELPVFKNAEDC